MLEAAETTDDEELGDMFARSDTSPEADVLGETSWREEVEMATRMGDTSLVCVLRDGLTPVALTIATRLGYVKEKGLRRFLRDLAARPL